MVGRLEDWENNIDPEEWLHDLLALTGDEDQKRQLFESMSQRGGMPLEKIEEVMALLIKTLLDISRGN